MTILVFILFGLLCAFSVLYALGAPVARQERLIADARVYEAFLQPDALLGLTIEQLEAIAGPCEQRDYWDYGDVSATWRASQVQYDVWFSKGHCAKITRSIKD
ncbi:hypothetical protein [Chitinolyticbacter albus]|uniref:hypothetical protein n=1 Tax=Chitinolyticbacter albus TaxID=2961951 RepID=UPI00210EB464|nr:hypothetical protein [Chitinolyticbacter albus]